MEPDRIECLTERERQVLRLVARNRGDSEIGSLLKISAATVKAHIKNARSKVGGIGRYELANAVAESEGRTPSIATHEKRIATPAPGVPDAAVSDDETERQWEEALNEQRAAFDHQEAELPAPLPWQGGSINDLNAAQRLARIGTIAFHLIAGLATLSIAMHLLQRFILER